MKAVFVLFWIIVSFSGFSQLTSVNLQVSGLTCPMCTRTVQKSLEKVPFVKEVRPDLETQEYLITFKDNKEVSFDELRTTVEYAGFSVALFEVNGNFQNLEVTKDSPILFGNQSFYLLNGDRVTLNGCKTLTVVEKGFLSPKALKKYCSDPKLKCMGKTNIEPSRRFYIVAI